jgi:hypothetical protein
MTDHLQTSWHGRRLGTVAVLALGHLPGIPLGWRMALGNAVLRRMRVQVHGPTGELLADQSLYDAGTRITADSGFTITRQEEESS